MADDKEAPLLLQYLFGEAAGAAQQGASERLLRWAEAFEAWLDEREKRYVSTQFETSKLAWKRLLRQRPKPPWELRREDFEAHAEWMQEQGLAKGTTGKELYQLASFYRWRQEHRIDPQVPAEFNPAAEARGPKLRRYEQAVLLSRAEVEALLDVLERDETPLGKRDYAFFLARLSMGIPTKKLRELRICECGFLSADFGGLISDFEDRGQAKQAAIWDERFAFPADVQDAILEYLQASGRKPFLNAESYIFSALACPFDDSMDGNQAQDWVEGRPVGRHDLLQSLKRYGRAAGLPERKLNFHSLHHTAIRLKLETGGGPRWDSLGEGISKGDAAAIEAIQAFMASPAQRKAIRDRLRCLPELPEDEPGSRSAAGSQAAIPSRRSHRYQPGEGMTHGFYISRLPAEEVQAVLAEDIHGIDEQMRGLRAIGRLLMERMLQAGSADLSVRLGEAYSLNAAHLAALIEFERKVQARQDQRSGGKSWLEETLDGLERVSVELLGKPFDREGFIQSALADTSESEAENRRLEEEVAGVRVVLRRALRLALEAETDQQAIRLAEVYGSACLRLRRLLEQGQGVEGRVNAFMDKLIDMAVAQVSKDWQPAIDALSGKSEERKESKL